MSHILSYIGSDNSTYVNGNDGANPSNANLQSLSIGDNIEGATFLSRNIAEQTNELKLYKTQTHNYFTWNSSTNRFVTDTSSAVNMPMAIIGWKTADNVTVQPGTQLTQNFINTHFTGNHLSLYAKWVNVYLIRVIIYVPGFFSTLDVRYNVAMSAYYSYSNNYNYPLTNNFKTIHDTGSDLGFTDGSHILTEFGVGNGCPDNGVITYFAVKEDPQFPSEDNVTIDITPANGYTNNYIPQYTMNGSVPNYECYIADALVREDKAPNVTFDSEPIDYLPSYNRWTIGYSESLLNYIDTDKTVFIPLVEKPTINVTVSPTGSGTVTGGGMYMPGDTCTITATGLGANTFSHWESVGTVGQISDNPYTFIVGNSDTFTAVFVGERTIWLSYLAGVDGSGTMPTGYVWYTVNEGTAHMSINTKEPFPHQYIQGTTLHFDTFHSYNGYMLMGWYQYTGQTRNPSTDTLLSSNTSYTFVIPSEDVKIYAFFDRL